MWMVVVGLKDSHVPCQLQNRQVMLIVASPFSAKTLQVVFKSQLCLFTVAPSYTGETFATAKVFFLAPFEFLIHLHLPCKFTNKPLEVPCDIVPPSQQHGKSHAKPILEVYSARLSNCGTISSYVHCVKHKTPPSPNAFFIIFF